MSTAAGWTARSTPRLSFVALHGESEWAFWLDGGGDPRLSRFSFIGDAAGPHAATVSYDVATGELEIGRGGRRERRHESVFEHLRSELRRLRPEPAGLPFEFDCGFVGYLGYELKAECGGEAAHASELPDAALLFADRVLAFDREERCVYLVCARRRRGGGRALVRADRGGTDGIDVRPRSRPRRMAGRDGLRAPALGRTASPGMSPSAERLIARARPTRSASPTGCVARRGRPGRSTATCGGAPRALRRLPRSGASPSARRRRSCSSTSTAAASRRGR